MTYIRNILKMKRSYDGHIENGDQNFNKIIPRTGQVN